MCVCGARACMEYQIVIIVLLSVLKGIHATSWLAMSERGTTLKNVKRDFVFYAEHKEHNIGPFSLQDHVGYKKMSVGLH